MPFVDVGGRKAEVKFAAVNATTVGNNTLVAAVTGRKIRLMSFVASLSGTAPTATFQSGAGGTALSGAIVPTSGAMILMPYNEAGWLETAAAALLNLSLAGTTPSCQGVLGYIEAE